jgi:hypothetical protein
MAKEKRKRFKRARQDAADEGLILQIIDRITSGFRNKPSRSTL